MLLKLKRPSSKSLKIWGTVLLIAVALYLLPPSWIVNDTLLLGAVRKGLDKVFTSKGLNVEVDKITWKQWNRIEAEGISVTTVDGTAVPFSLKKMELKISFWSYLKNPKAPSALPKQLWLVSPYLELERYEDNTFNLQRYFDFKDRGNRVMSMLIGVKNGKVLYKDAKLGSYELHDLDGLVDMRRRTDSAWKFNGTLAMQKDVLFETEGRFNLNEKHYAGKLDVSNFLLNELNSILPKNKFDYELIDGYGDVRVDFGIENKKFTLKRVNASVKNVAVRLNPLPNPVEIIDAKLRIENKKLTIDNCQIRHEQARLKAQGNWNTADNKLDFQVKAQHFQLALLRIFFETIDQRELTGELNAEVNVTGTANLPILNGKANLKQGAITFPFADIENVVARLKLIDNDIVFEQADGFAYNAPMTASGVIHDFFDPVYNIDFQIKQIDPKNIKAKFDNLQEIESKLIDLDGTISGEGITPLFAMTAQTVALSYRNWVLDNVKLDFAWNHYDQALEINHLEAMSYDGKVNGNGKILFEKEKIIWDLYASLDDVDVARLSYNDIHGEKGVVSVNAVIKGEWVKGTKAEIGSIFGVLKGRDLVYQNISTDTVQAVFTWNNKGFLVDSIQFNIGSGRVYGSLIYNEKGIFSYLSAENVRFKELMKRNDYPIDGIIGGNAFISGSLNDLTLKARCRASQTTCFDKEFGNLSGELIYHDKLLNLTKVDVNTVGGNFVLSGTLGFSTNSPLSMEVSGEKIMIEKFTNWFPGTEIFDISGFGRVDIKLSGSVINPEYTGTVKLSNFTVREMLLETGNLSFSGDLKSLKIDEFLVASRQSTAKLSGNISEKTLDLNFTGTLTELDKLKIYYDGNLLTGKLNFSGTMSGATAKPRLTANVSGEQISYGKFQNGVLKTNVKMTYPQLELDAFSLQFGKATIVGNGKINLSNENDVDARLQLSMISVADLLEAAGIRDSGAVGILNGDVLVTGPLHAPLLTANGMIDNGAFRNQPFSGTFFCSYANRRLDLNALDIKHKNGTLKCQGRWRDGDGLRLQGEINRFPLDTLNAFSEIDFGVLGEADGQISLSWNDEGITGEYDLIASAFGVHRERIGNLFVNGAYSEQGSSVKSGELHSNSGVLSFSGYIPWNREFVEKFNLPVRDGLYRNIDITAQFFNASAEAMNALAPQSFLLNKGTLNGTLKIDGTVDAPILSGDLIGNKLTVDLPMLGITLDDFDVQVTMKDNVMLINSALAKVKKASLKIGGVVNFSQWLPQELDLYFVGDDIPYKAPFFDGYVTLDIRMQGNWMEPLVRGKVSLAESRIFLPPVSSEEAFWNPTFDLNLSAGKNVRFYQKGIADVYLQGQTTVQGKMADLQLDGRFDTPKGTISLYGKNFMINNGYAAFNPEQGMMPYLDIISNTRIPQYEIILNIKGLVGPELKLLLSARPHMTQNEIYTALNWPQYENGEDLQAEDVIGSNMNILTDSVLGGLFEGVKTTLHLDYLYLEADYFENEYRINVGDHITDNLFLSYGRSLDTYEVEETWELNYNINSRLMFGNTYSPDDGSEWRLRYGFRF